MTKGEPPSVMSAGFAPFGVPRSRRSKFWKIEFQRGLDPIWAMESRGKRCGRDKIVTDPPGKIALGSGRTVVIAVGSVGEPVVCSRAVFDLVEGEQRDEV